MPTLPHFAPGLEDVVFGDSRLSLVDGAAGRLILAGYKIEDLAAHAQYEEVAHLLWKGRLPTAAELEALAAADPFFTERSLYPNVDYYSAIVLYTINLDVDMFTPVFAMSRIVGWTAHVMEQIQSSRQLRPDIRYTGAVDREWTPIAEREG